MNELKRKVTVAAERLTELNGELIQGFLDEGFLIYGSRPPIGDFAFPIAPPYTITTRYGQELLLRPRLDAYSEPQIPLAQATLMSLDLARSRGTAARYASEDEIVIAHHIGPAQPGLFVDGTLSDVRADRVLGCFGYMAFLDREGAKPSPDRPFCFEYPENGRARVRAIAEVTLGDLVRIAPEGNIVQATRKDFEAQLPPYLALGQEPSPEPRVVSFAAWQARQNGETSSN